MYTKSLLTAFFTTLSLTIAAPCAPSSTTPIPVSSTATASSSSSTPSSSCPSSYKSVEFTKTFEQRVEENTEMTVSWSGGSGRYDVYTIVKYPGIPDYYPAYELSNTSLTTFVYHVPAHFSQNFSTIEFGVSDKTPPSDVVGKGCQTYDLSGDLAIINDNDGRSPL